MFFIFFTIKKPIAKPIQTDILNKLTYTKLADFTFLSVYGFNILFLKTSSQVLYHILFTNAFILINILYYDN